MVGIAGNKGKKEVMEIVKDLLLGFNDLDTSVNLNILPLGSYDILIGMDWLESHKVVIDYLHKIFSSVDEEDKYHTMNEISRPLSTRQILALQCKKCIRKGCRLYGIKIKEFEPEK